MTNGIILQTNGVVDICSHFPAVHAAELRLYFCTSSSNLLQFQLLRNPCSAQRLLCSLQVAPKIMECAL